MLISLLILAASPTFVAFYLNFLVHTKKADDSSSGITNVHPGNGIEFAPPLLHTSEDAIDPGGGLLEGLQCIDETVGPCCAPWHVDTDTWWVHHPEWEVSTENENTTHTCYTLLAEETRKQFLRQLYTLQWGNNATNIDNNNYSNSTCLNQVQKTQISSGYAAALMATARSFYAAYQSGKSFQISKRHVNANWNFSPRARDIMNSNNTNNQSTTTMSTSTTAHSHWAYCETEDMNCYYLPLSPCPGEIGRDDADRGIKPTKPKQRKEFLWLRRYAFRPRQRLRQKVLEFRANHLKLQADHVGMLTSPVTPCAAIHVRRGDIAFGRGRRYAAVEEYLQAGNITTGETVVVLTDDVSTIEEIEQYHAKDYNWIYLERPRHRGSEGGFEGFIPSSDPAFEILAILVEIQLASQCNKLVHGKSGFVATIADEMELSGHPYELIYLQTQLDKGDQPKLDPKERAAGYLKAIQDRHKDNEQEV
jgi:hypothetical protein